MITKLSDILLYENTTPVQFILKNNYELIQEDDQYLPKPTQAGIPRFSIKGLQGIENIEVNKPMKPTEKLIITAIKYGMIFNVVYKGAKDSQTRGHERILEFMVLGRSSAGKLLIRAYHLKGFSLSNNGNIEKIWRLFRLDRVLSITFTGRFYRLAPDKYQSHDKIMIGGIIASADFNEIRKNQQELLKTKEIENIKDIEIGAPKEEGKPEFNTIRVKTSGTQLDILKPYDNPYIKNEENSSGLLITFLKTLYGNKYMAILGAMGKENNIVKVLDGKGKTIGVYKVLSSISGDTLKKIKKVKGNTIFDLHFFDKKL